MSTISTLRPSEIAESSQELPAREPEGRYEVVNGRVIAKPTMGAFEVWTASSLFARLLTAPGISARGRIMTEMLFLLDAATNLQRRPDLAFLSFERWPRNRAVPRTSAWEVAPDLAVEVISPSNQAAEVVAQVGEYFRHGVRSVWVVYPLEEMVYAYASPTRVQILTRADVLECPELLPGFRLPLSDLFEPGAAAE